MNNADFERETAYQTTMSLVRTLKRSGAFTDEEYRRIDATMLEKYRPVLGMLLAEEQNIHSESPGKERRNEGNKQA